MLENPQEYLALTKNVSENPPASPMYMKGKLSEHKGASCIIKSVDVEN